MKNISQQTGAYEIDYGGERLLLLPEHAIWWPTQQTLLVADMHIGKAAAFRKLGQPVPQGTTSETLTRLDKLVQTWPVRQLICLGDFLHARAAHAPQTLAALRDWRAHHSDLTFLLVRGNHDVHAGDPPADLNIDIVDEPYQLGRLTLRHIPSSGSEPWDNRYSLAGHLHPAYILQGRGVSCDRLLLPCFVFRNNQGILPAFGSFTGHYTVRAVKGQSLYVCGGERVWAVPNHKGRIAEHM